MLMVLVIVNAAGQTLMFGQLHAQRMVGCVGLLCNIKNIFVPRQLFLVDASVDLPPLKIEPSALFPNHYTYYNHYMWMHLDQQKVTRINHADSKLQKQYFCIVFKSIRNIKKQLYSF